MNNKKLFNYIDHYGGNSNSNSNSIKINNLDNMLDFESSDVIDNTEDYTSSLLDKILSNDSTNNIQGGTITNIVTKAINNIDNVEKVVNLGINSVKAVDDITKKKCKCCINNEDIIKQIDDIINKLELIKTSKN
jgi:hypothetical protein